MMQEVSEAELTQIPVKQTILEKITNSDTFMELLNTMFIRKELQYIQNAMF